MPVTYVIKFDVVPEQRTNFLRLLGAVLDAMRNEPTFHQAVLHRDPASENRFMLYETWESHDEVVNVQIKRPYRDAWNKALPALLARDRDIEVWESLRSDYARSLLSSN
ncbi:MULTISPECIES: putative quinol monooxygenase [Bradyrhizobium]|uniref:putative quinol monooxygenase n=1 Tax=Bradyrhizobium TaxID=374 RepID=UPI0004BAD05B|nr:MULTISPECIES: putative quinol monooxygenase [Bradyrhizobium]MBR0944719.1 antibiotic biosynthesis monooxygenase [Bradyrhizobium liaoningense]MBR1033982.1 antibiotic biosynthesis monooxygenase [Bradyrhizobium liaoningense]MDI2072457.1 putative quinol monooxygenase [Bradyrhizobium sp. Mp27]